MINKLYILPLLAVVSLSSCHRHYTSSGFEQKTSKHKVIAVLPPKIMLTGNQPSNYTPYEIAMLEEKESRLFQESLSNNILRKGHKGKNLLNVNVQPVNNTLAILQENNISIRESWDKGDEELARLLNVDAVVRTTIQKDRIMSDLASAGIFAGKKILDVVINRPPVTPMPFNKTADIRATCSLVSNGETLWSDSYKRESDFSSPANDVIDRITNKFARRFPYKTKA